MFLFSGNFKSVCTCLVPAHNVWTLTLCTHLSMLERVRTQAQWVSPSPDSKTIPMDPPGTLALRTFELTAGLTNRDSSWHTLSIILTHFDSYGPVWTHLDPFWLICTPFSRRLLYFWVKAKHNTYSFLVIYECSSPYNVIISLLSGDGWDSRSIIAAACRLISVSDSYDLVKTFECMTLHFPSNNNDNKIYQEAFWRHNVVSFLLNLSF